MASQISLIQLINLVSRDLDTAKIEEGFKHEPALAANLLRIVNSVGYGLNPAGQAPIATLAATATHDPGRGNTRPQQFPAAAGRCAAWAHDGIIA